MARLVRAFFLIAVPLSGTAVSLAAQEEVDSTQSLRAALKECPHKLVFETDRDGNWELYVMNADGSGLRNLTNTKHIDEVYPKASPDGAWIAFCADTVHKGKRRRDVFRMRVDGSERQKIADNARDPFWSPDGKKLGFLPQEYRRFSFATWSTKGLRIHDLRTGETRNHPNKRLEHLYVPTWTNDGKWILATVHGGLGYSHAIVAIAADGDAVSPLRLWGCRADLAPDGRRVTWGWGDYSLGLGDLDLDGERPRAYAQGRVVRNRRREGQTYHSDWCPDGRFIVYTSGPKSRRRRLWDSVQPQCPGVEAKGWDIWVADASKENVRVRLTMDGKSNKEPDWIRAPVPAK